MTESDRFISEVFCTTDERFCWQKVGRHYLLYDRDLEYGFLKEFSGLVAMQKFMNEKRNQSASNGSPETGDQEV